MRRSLLVIALLVLLIGGFIESGSIAYAQTATTEVVSVKE